MSGSETDVVQMEFRAGTDIRDAVRMMVEVADGENVVVTGRFNDVDLVVRPGEGEGPALAFWQSERERLSREYRESPQGRADAREAERRAEMARAAEERGVVGFRFRPDGGAGAWSDFITAEGGAGAVRAHEYGMAILRFSSRWARLMDVALAGGARLEDIAEPLSDTADEEGISGAMGGVAVGVLIHCWEHGEALKQLWESRYDDQGVPLEKPPFPALPGGEVREDE